MRKTIRLFLRTFTSNTFFLHILYEVNFYIKSKLMIAQKRTVLLRYFLSLMHLCQFVLGVPLSRPLQWVGQQRRHVIEQSRGAPRYLQYISILVLVQATQQIVDFLQSSLSAQFQIVKLHPLSIYLRIKRHVVKIEGKHVPKLIRTNFRITRLRFAQVYAQILRSKKLHYFSLEQLFYIHI